MKKGNEGRRRGSALVSSLVFVMIAAALGAAMMQMEAGFGRNLRQSVDTKRALYVAEAGLSEGFLAVVQGKSGTIASAAQPAQFADGVYWVEATKHSDGKVSLQSTGLCDSGRFSVSMTIEPTGDSVGALGLFGTQRVDVGSGAVIDGFDSALGSFDSQATNTAYGLTTSQGAKLASNGNVAVHGLVGVGLLGIGTAVFGDVRPGPTGAAMIEPGAKVTGSTTPLSAPAKLPPIDVPVIPSTGSLTVTTGTKKVGPGEVHLDSIRVNRGAKLEIEGPATLVVGNLKLDARAEWKLDSSNGPIGVFCTESLNLASGSTLSSATKKPADVAVLVSASQPVDLNGDGTLDPPVAIAAGGEFYGLLYAPSADLTMPSSLRVFGAVTARNLMLSASVRATIDKSPAGAGVGVRATPKFLSWKVVELPDVPLVKDRKNPLVALKLAGIVPAASALASPENLMRIRYVDKLTGNCASYYGPESAFNWNLVQEVKAVIFLDQVLRSED